MDTAELTRVARYVPEHYAITWTEAVVGGRSFHVCVADHQTWPCATIKAVEKAYRDGYDLGYRHADNGKDPEFEAADG